MDMLIFLNFIPDSIVIHLKSLCVSVKDIFISTNYLFIKYSCIAI
jgi:hypothetical protein